MSFRSSGAGFEVNLSTSFMMLDMLMIITLRANLLRIGYVFLVGFTPMNGFVVFGEHFGQMGQPLS